MKCASDMRHVFLTLLPQFFSSHVLPDLQLINILIIIKISMGYSVDNLNKTYFVLPHSSPRHQPRNPLS